MYKSRRGISIYYFPKKWGAKSHASETSNLHLFPSIFTELTKGVSGVISNVLVEPSQNVRVRLNAGVAPNLG